MKVKVGNKRCHGYDTDVFMKDLWRHLARDFRTSMWPTYCYEQEIALSSKSMAEFRSFKWPDRLQAPPIVFKMEYQLENLFKRYRFKHDQFSVSDLEQMTVEKFTATQERIREPLALTNITRQVIDRARFHVTRILGAYNCEEVYDHAQFSRRSTVGCPMRQSYLYEKLSASRRLTGSVGQISWFERYLSSDYLLAEIIGEKELTPIDCLAITNVPKSYKALRTIMPNTLIGSFYTYGLGKCIELRLRKEGYDIRNLQRLHGIYAREASRTRRSVTADLSAASDSFTREMVQLLVPPDWFDALDLGRIDQVERPDGTRMPLESFMTMGIGFTFPLQTLLFLCLLKSLADLTKTRGLISVYGDDLVYPQKLHRYVARIFPQLNLILNEDKTYVTSNFRESCGSDFFHGCDVRPFQPEGGHQMLPRKQFATFVYKVLNGLVLRWPEEVIPKTLHFLQQRLLTVDGMILQVPPSFPDYSGYKVASPREDWILNYSPITKPVSQVSSRTMDQRDGQHFAFVAYLERATEHIVPTVLPYYWQSQRGSLSSESDTGPYTPPLEILRYVDSKVQPRNYRNSLGKRIRLTVPCVDEKNGSKIVRYTALVADWI